MAVLVAVFAPLDVIVQGRTLNLRSVGATVTSVAVLFAIGFFLEVKSWKR
jgi:hypothetical protein